MIIKEYNIVSTKTDGTFPTLEIVKEYNYEPYFDIFTYTNKNNYFFELFFFGEQLKLQNSYTEQYYVLSYNNNDEIIGFIKISSGSREETSIPCDILFTFLILSGSCSFITIHNHTNNISQKSDIDIYSDEYLLNLGKMLKIEYKKGLIITKDVINNMHKTAWEEEKTYYNNSQDYGDNWNNYILECEKFYKEIL